MRHVYDTLAARYDLMHGRWLHHAGGEAQAALEASLVTRIAPGQRVLDAGCGTGTMARSLMARFGGQLSLTLLDASREMLARTADIEADRVHGSLLAMPFEAGLFDIAVAAWSIEATGDETAAIRELMRVVRPAGHVIVAFCATEPAGRIGARVLKKTVALRRAGSFIDAARVEDVFWRHGAARVIRHRCGGPAAVIDAKLGQAAGLARAA